MRSFAVAALLLGALPARADAPASMRCNGMPTLPAIACRHVLRVGMFPGLMPFVATGADADDVVRLSHGSAPARASDGRAVAGFDIDLAAAAARALDVQLRIVLVERFEDLLPGLVADRYDVVISGLTRNLERARTVAFSDPYFTSGLQVLVRDGANVPTVQALTAAHARVVVRAGTTADSFARTVLAGVVVRTVPNDAAMFAAVERGEVDAMVADYVNVRDAEVRGRLHASVSPLEDRRFTVEHFAFAVRQGDRDWLGWLNLLLRESKGAGEFHTIAARYNAWFRSER